MKEFWKFRSLLYELITRDIKVKYRRSVLGLLWTILNPLLMMCVLYLVFSKLFRFDIENYAIYVLSGQVIFNYYQVTTTDAMMSILNNSTLIKKVYIPKYMLVLVKTLSGTVSLLASYLALLIVIVVTGGKIYITNLLAIFPFVSVVALSLGAGLLLAALTVRFRDILHLYGVFCTLLFYVTPIIYPLSILPNYMKKLVVLNPLTAIMDVFRTIVLEGRVPQSGQLLYSILVPMMILVIGSVFFKKRENTFILDL